MPFPQTKQPALILKDWESRAFREGRKRQMRVPCKEAVTEHSGPAHAVCQCDHDGSWFAWWGPKPQEGWHAMTHHCYPEGGGFRCPLGPVGSLVLGKEAFDFITGKETEVKAGKATSSRISQVIYRADGGKRFSERWTPARNMPPAFCRLVLRLVEVRVERVQEISAKDILAEGVVERAHHNELGKCPVSAVDKCCYPDLLSCWAAACDSKFGKGTFQKNGWVWVYVLEPTETK